MKRCEIKQEDKWDLSKIFGSMDEYNKTYQDTLEMLDKIKKMKGSITKNADNLYQFLELDDALSLNLEKICVYSYLNYYSDMTDIDGKNLREKADKLAEKATLDTSFVRSELLSNDEKYIRHFIDIDKRLEKFRFSIEELYRYKSHTLTEQEERIMSLASNALGTGDSAFSSLDNADVKFGNITVDGKDIELTHSNYINFLMSQNREVRKDAFFKYYEFYINHQNVLSELYKSQIKEDDFFSKARNFNSPLEMSLYVDNINPSVYYNLISVIHENLGLLSDYMEFRKNYLGLNELHMYDMHVDLVTADKKEYTFNEARKLIEEALKPLGTDYNIELKRLLDERAVDKYPCDGKRNGAYEWGCFGVDPYVSINFNCDADSVSALAHELGHAMHTVYSNKKQEHLYANYPIFLAEIASTVNEVLLNEYLLKNAKNNKEKLLYITKFLDNFRTTVFRQTMFAEFELLVHDKYAEDEPLTVQTLNSLYFDLNKKYYGKNVISDDIIAYEWSRIPHFYTPFYVYQYATGFISAISIASDILSGRDGALDKYIEFLSSGGSDYPLTILKKCGIDLTSSECYNKAFKMFREKLDEAKEIYKDVNNNG